jgi:hypothetical protein
MATTINQTKAIRQLYQLVTVSSPTRHRTARGSQSLYDAKSRHLSWVNCKKSFSFRWSRGSDLRLLRLTMDGLPDRHIWGATPCIKDRPRPKVRPG